MLPLLLACTTAPETPIVPTGTPTGPASPEIPRPTPDILDSPPDLVVFLVSGLRADIPGADASAPEARFWAAAGTPTIRWTHAYAQTSSTFLSLGSLSATVLAESTSTPERVRELIDKSCGAADEDPLGDRPTLQWGTTWYHPYGFYLIASSLLVAPISEWSIRLPMVIVALLDVWLIYLVAMRWFESRFIAIVEIGRAHV